MAQWPWHVKDDDRPTVGFCFSQTCLATTRKLFEAIVVLSTCWRRGVRVRRLHFERVLVDHPHVGLRIRAQ
jgi:hypothetical protein